MGKLMAFLVDVFELILGQEFLRRNKVVLVPWLDKLVIVNERKTWVLRTTTRKPKCGEKIASMLRNEERSKMIWYTAVVGEIE
jgi:hypothetical protein